MPVVFLDDACNSVSNIDNNLDPGSFPILQNLLLFPPYMTRKPYSAAAVKHLFWFQEFKTVARLLVKGRTLDDIRAINERENLLKAKTAYRGKTIFSALAARFEAIPPEFLDLFEKTDVLTQKLIAAIATMAADNLFFDFMSEVYREKLLIGEKTLAVSDFVQFFRNKQVQDEKAASWKDITLNRLGRAYRNILLQSGLIELPIGKPNSKKTEWLVRKPVVNKQLAGLLQKTNMGAFYSALTGEDQ
ncbi:MAG: DUF1819 family protein [Treponema sp.]|jgi:hypothetical protein|nr:DUF1819 family protein [Treponema sp.]